MRTLENPADRDAIAQRIEKLEISDKRLWGRMSLDQMVCHLCDSYKIFLGEKKTSAKTGFLQRTLVKFIALRLPIKWPKSTPTPPEVEQGVGGTPPTELARDREELLRAFARFCSEVTHESPQHPIFGQLTREELLRWGYLHADHHLRQFGR
jgi:hypothetical protein